MLLASKQELYMVARVLWVFEFYIFKLTIWYIVKPSHIAYEKVSAKG